MNEMTGFWVCADASLVIKLVVEEIGSREARALWRSWQYEGRDMAQMRQILHFLSLSADIATY